MSYSHFEVVSRFISGKSKHITSGNLIFHDNDTLYSYGSHFPLLVKTSFGFIMNADKYSSSTSNHQSHVMRHAKISIPFSVLNRAGIPHSPDNHFNLIDTQAQRWDIINYHHYVNCETNNPRVPEEFLQSSYHRHSQDKRETISVEQFNKLSAEEKSYVCESPVDLHSITGQWNLQSKDITFAQNVPIWFESQERRPEHNVIEYSGKYYLSGMDGQNYFLAQLPEPVKTVDEAFTLLKHPDIRSLPQNDVIRQGEWFFIKCGYINDDRRKLYNQMQKNFILPIDREGSNQHIATRGIVLNGQILVSGHIRHSNHDHRTLHLSNADNPLIYRAYHNTAVNSFSAQGNVD